MHFLYDLDFQMFQMNQIPSFSLVHHHQVDQYSIQLYFYLHLLTIFILISFDLLLFLTLLYRFYISFFLLIYLLAFIFLSYHFYLKFVQPCECFIFCQLPNLQNLFIYYGQIYDVEMDQILSILQHLTSFLNYFQLSIICKKIYLYLQEYIDYRNNISYRQGYIKFVIKLFIKIMKTNRQFNADCQTQSKRLKQIDDILDNIFAQSSEKLKQSLSPRFKSQHSSQLGDKTNVLAKNNNNEQGRINKQQNEMRPLQINTRIINKDTRYNDSKIWDIIEKQPKYQKMFKSIMKDDIDESTKNLDKTQKTNKKQITIDKMDSNKKQKTQDKKYQNKNCTKILSKQLEMMKQLVDLQRHLKQNIFYHNYQALLKVKPVRRLQTN